MEPFYCKLKDEKHSGKFFGIAIDSQTIIQPDPQQNGQLVPTVVIGVVLKEIGDDGSLIPSSQPSPAYIPPTGIQYLELVSESDEGDILEYYYGISSDNDEELEEDYEENTVQTRPSTTNQGVPANA